MGLHSPVDYTVVNGRVTVENGRLAAVDEAALAARANASCEAYLRRA